MAVAQCSFQVLFKALKRCFVCFHEEGGAVNTTGGQVNLLIKAVHDKVAQSAGQLRLGEPEGNLEPHPSSSSPEVPQIPKEQGLELLHRRPAGRSPGRVKLRLEVPRVADDFAPRARAPPLDFTSTGG